MPEAKKVGVETSTPSETRVESAKAAPPGMLPGESTDPAVHQLLARRDAHRMAAESNPSERETQEKLMAAIDDELRGMGLRVDR